VIPIAMNRWEKPYHGRSHAMRSRSKRCFFRLAGEVGTGCIVFGCNAAGRNHQASGTDDQWTVRARQDLAGQFRWPVDPPRPRVHSSKSRE
jgi:hypothetical protein